MHLPLLLLLGALAVPLLLLWIGAVVSMLRHERTPLLGLWIVAALVFPLAGPLAWFLVGRGVAEDRGPRSA